MTLQTLVVLSAVLGALLYLAKNLANDLCGPGGCASGCGSCKVKACPAKAKTQLIHRA